ncbi:MAG: UMP kinase, partial [Sulfolobales archaeon]
IYSTRLNAYLLTYYLYELTPKKVPETLEEFLVLWSLGKVVIAGGFQPGQSTNAVSALIAESISADLLINLTNVEGVYDKDPKKYTDAKLLEYVYYDELERILEENQSYLAGAYELLDPLSIKILKRSKIKALIVNYQNISKLIDIIDGRIKLGSIVLPR